MKLDNGSLKFIKKDKRRDWYTKIRSLKKVKGEQKYANRKFKKYPSRRTA